MPQDFGLHHTNFLIRRHNNPDCLLFCSEWWQHISAHSKRDQLSFDFVRWKLPRSKVGTLDISYNDNSAFRCSGIHRSPRRIVSDHLGSTVRCNDLPHPFLAASYNPQYDAWPAQFLDHLRHLNEIASGTGEPLEGNLCYFHCQQDFKYSPPDPRRGERRETFLRALAGRSRLLEIGFNAGHSTLLALTHSNAICDTQNDITEFSKSLLHERVLTRSVLLRGIERALHQDITAAAEILFSWIANAAQQRERIYLGLSAGVDLPCITIIRFSKWRPKQKVAARCRAFCNCLRFSMPTMARKVMATHAPLFWKRLRLR